jgi:hypothetical protein
VTTPPTEQRPGWGKGDKNHEHTGPAGQDGSSESKKEKEKEKEKGKKEK